MRIYLILCIVSSCKQFSKKPHQNDEHIPHLYAPKWLEFHQQIITFDFHFIYGLYSQTTNFNVSLLSVMFICVCVSKPLYYTFVLTLTLFPIPACIKPLQTFALRCKYIQKHIVFNPLHFGQMRQHSNVYEVLYLNGSVWFVHVGWRMKRISPLKLKRVWNRSVNIWGLSIYSVPRRWTKFVHVISL